MIAETILTLIVSISTVDDGVATIEKGRMAGLRPGDIGRIYYQLTVGTETKRIDVGEGTLLAVEDARSRLGFDDKIIVRPSYLVEFNLPLSSTDSNAGSGTGSGDPPLQSLFERLVAGNQAVQAELSQLIQERRTQLETSTPALAELEAEVRTCLEILEAGTETTASAEDVAGQQAMYDELAETRANAARLTRQLELANIAQQQLRDELAIARAESSRPDTPRAGTEAEVLALVRDWAAAWSGQRVEEYLSFYAHAFQPQDGLSRDEWEAERRPLVQNPRCIAVQPESPEILSLEAGAAVVRFRQFYCSDTFKIASIKLLELVNEEGKWRISAERIE